MFMSNAVKIETVATHVTSDVQSIGVDEVDHSEIINIITELEGTKRQLNVERQRVSELEDQLSSLSKSKNQSTKYLLCFTVFVVN